ncbi:MAG: SET domain-containing protein [bacterium]|nr:SET domain-containing protein [bacterium]
MLHPLIEVVDLGVIEGKGLIARGLIREGEVVSRLEPGQPHVQIADVMTWPQEEQDKLLHYGYQCSETEIVNEQGPERFMNHSCDPNTWWLDDDTMVAMRDIQPGEELTYDYATTEITIPFQMKCYCNAATCRKVITNEDYQNPEWQARFGEHLPNHTKKAIAQLRQQG